jgi:hypothetical protein
MRKPLGQFACLVLKIRILAAQEAGAADEHPLHEFPRG